MQIRLHHILAVSFLAAPIFALWWFVSSGLWSQMLSFIYTEQRGFQRGLSSSLGSLSQNGGTAATWALISGSFLYGLVHAAGPGHGKIVLTTYLLTNKDQTAHSLKISTLAALCQGAVAIILVYGLIFIAGYTARDTNGAALWSERISYFLVAAMGAWLLWRAVKSVFAKRNESHHHVHVHGEHNYSHANHDHHHHEDHSDPHHVHGDNCGCGHKHMPDAEDLSKATDWRTTAGIILSIGMRPCTGAILVLVLAKSLNLAWAGVAATFAMSVGTAIAISAIAFVAVNFRNTASRLLQFEGQTAKWGGSILMASGGLLLLAIGMSLIIGSLSRGGTIGF